MDNYIKLRDLFKEREGADKFNFDDRKWAPATIHAPATLEHQASMQFVDPDESQSSVFALDNSYNFTEFDGDATTEEAKNFHIINSRDGAEYTQKGAIQWWLDLLRNSDNCLDKLDADQEDIVKTMLIHAKLRSPKHWSKTPNQGNFYTLVAAFIKKLTDPQVTDIAWYCNARDESSQRQDGIPDADYEQVCKEFRKSYAFFMKQTKKSGKRKSTTTSTPQGSARKKSRASASSSSGKKKPRSSNV